MDIFMATVTNLGDAAVTIAAAALLFLCFLWTSKSTAWQWLGAVGACGIVTASSKLALYLHGALPAIWLFSPSGHVAASVLVYGVLPAGAQGQRRSWVLLAAATIGLVAVSRVYLQAHSGMDVVAGALIGGACLAWFLLARSGWTLAGPLRAGAPLAIGVCLLGAMAGWRLHLDRMLHDVAAYLGS